MNNNKKKVLKIKNWIFNHQKTDRLGSIRIAQQQQEKGEFNVISIE